MVAAFQFLNTKANVFPFETPRNEAVSDIYQFARGGASQAESQIPSLAALAKNVNVDQLIPKADEALSFVQPSKAQPNIDRILNKAESVKDGLEIG